jgi:hypothetical protein
VSKAKFIIEGTPSSDGGYDASASSSLTLRLEQLPTVGVDTCVFSCPVRTAGAPAPTFTPSSGIASPSSAEVELAIGAGVHSYLIKCMTNGGKAEPGADGKPDYGANVSYRIVSVRTTGTGLRKVIVGESFEYNTVEGYFAAFNEMVEKLEALQQREPGAKTHYLKLVAASSAITDDTTWTTLYTMGVPVLRSDTNAVLAEASIVATTLVGGQARLYDTFSLYQVGGVIDLDTGGKKTATIKDIFAVLPATTSQIALQFKPTAGGSITPEAGCILQIDELSQS